MSDLAVKRRQFSFVSSLSLCCMSGVLQNGALITFAPYSKTLVAYKDLQNCVAQANANIDYIIYQVDADPYVVAQQQANLVAAQKSTPAY